MFFYECFSFSYFPVFFGDKNQFCLFSGSKITNINSSIKNLICFRENIKYYCVQNLGDLCWVFLRQCWCFQLGSYSHPGTDFMEISRHWLHTDIQPLTSYWYSTTDFIRISRHWLHTDIQTLTSYWYPGTDFMQISRHRLHEDIQALTSNRYPGTDSIHISRHWLHSDIQALTSYWYSGTDFILIFRHWLHTDIQAPTSCRNPGTDLKQISRHWLRNDIQGTDCILIFRHWLHTDIQALTLYIKPGTDWLHTNEQVLHHSSWHWLSDTMGKVKEFLTYLQTGSLQLSSESWMSSCTAHCTTLYHLFIKNGLNRWSSQNYNCYCSHVFKFDLIDMQHFGDF